jgi:plastocyanin
MTKRLAPALLSLALVALPLAGCGSKDKSSSSDTTSSAPSTSSGGGTSAAGNVVKVEMKNIEFIPGRVTAKVGQTIEWTNNDGVAHTVTAKADGIDSGNVNAGSKFEFTAKKAGTINYVCEIHPGQKGTIVVK